MEIGFLMITHFHRCWYQLLFHHDSQSFRLQHAHYLLCVHNIVWCTLSGSVMTRVAGFKIGVIKDGVGGGGDKYRTYNVAIKRSLH